MLICQGWRWVRYIHFVIQCTEGASSCAQSTELCLISCCSIIGGSFRSALRGSIPLVGFFNFFVCWVIISWFTNSPPSLLCGIGPCLSVCQFHRISGSLANRFFSHTTFRTPKDSFSVCVVTHVSVLNKEHPCKFALASVSKGLSRVRNKFCVSNGDLDANISVSVSQVSVKKSVHKYLATFGY